MQVFTEGDVMTALGATDIQYLGTGGFGETWRVNDYAVKIIHRHSADRVDREVKGLGRVDHPNVVKLHAVETVSIGGADLLALRFDYVAGGDMQQALGRGEHLSVGGAPAFLEALLGGVRSLHTAGVLHRDLKPGNIALRGGSWSEPVILDLGLARLVDLSSITTYPAVVGTLAFMAPEQILGRRVRKAADVFAAGLLTRMALTGEHPFLPPGVSVTDADQLLHRIEQGPAELPPGLPVGFAVLLDQMVSYVEHTRGSTTACLRALAEL